MSAARLTTPKPTTARQGDHRGTPGSGDETSGAAAGAPLELSTTLLLSVAAASSFRYYLMGSRRMLSDHHCAPSGRIPAAPRRRREDGVMSGLVHRILGLPGWLVLVIAGVVVFAEDALFVGFVLPGETVALLAGAAAKIGHVSLAGVLVVVVVAAVVGDTVGYEIGRHVGPRVLNLGFLEKRRKRLDDAQDFLARRGGTAVFLGRWVAFFRAVLPFLAGSARMRYLKFLGFNAAGGLAWGATVVLLGYAAGASYAQVEKTFGPAAAVVVLAVVLVAVVVWRIRKRRADKRADAA
jgi:membrane protein DedA with SNARE-associated domain